MVVDLKWDPYRIRFYTWRNMGIMAGCTALVTPLIIDAIVPEYMGPYKRQKEYQEQTIVITDAGSKIGQCLAWTFALRQFRVIMGCKDMNECKLMRRNFVLHSRNNALSCRHLDVEDANSINEFANDLIKNEPYVNILVNTASLQLEGKEKEINKYGIERMYFVNFLAPYLLTFKLLGKLEETAKRYGNARIINVMDKPKKGSKVALSDINFEKRKYNSELAWKQSKLALAYFTILLERHNRERDNNVYVYGANTGFKAKLVRGPRLPSSTLLGSMKDYAGGFYTISALQASSTVAALSMDTDFANRAKAGQHYGIRRVSWGWGVADKDEQKAQQVWNHAYNFLLNLPDASPGEANATGNQAEGKQTSNEAKSGVEGTASASPEKIVQQPDVRNAIESKKVEAKQ